jgi:2-dehydro-3-deoxygalactonokinase
MSPVLYEFPAMHRERRHDRAGYVGVDWGLSERRAYVFAADGQCIGFHKDNEGMLASRGRCATSLDMLVGRLGLDRSVPMFVAGMSGSVHGRHEIPFLDIDTRLSELGKRMIWLEDRRFAIPGYRQALPAVDMLRGEETLCLGLTLGRKASEWIVVPGTHSKWVCVRGGRIQRWVTFATGELFALHRHLGSLAPLLEAQYSDDPDAFDDGVDLAHTSVGFSHALHIVRTRAIIGDMPAAKTLPMLSGLLIGMEFRGMARIAKPGRSLRLVAEPGLNALYRRAAAGFGWNVGEVEPAAVLGTAFRHLYQARVTHEV